MPSWFSSHLTHTQKPRGAAGRVGVGYHETGASNWSLKTEIHQLEPYTYRVCACVYTYARACLHPNINTHTWRGATVVETVHVRLDII